MNQREAVLRLVRGAVAALERSRTRIDDLNVYPVPDGDTGTNLALTARAVLEVSRIAAVDKVVSIGIGVGDLSADMGVPLYGSDGQLNELFVGPKVQVALAGVAFGARLLQG